MFEQIRDKMRDKIRSFEYLMTIHAEEEMENDHLTIYDVENVILTGEIIERQKDGETDEWKYIIAGEPIDDESVTIVTKLSVTGKLVIITVYIEDYEYEN